MTFRIFMSKNPIISVLMPVYNAEKYVAEAVESILNQTLGDLEFLIVDDGSSDGSLAILKRYAEIDQRICLVSRPNTGYIPALNEMLELAKGKYLARIDHDDVALPERFAKQFEYLEQHPECVVIGSRLLLIDSDGDPMREFVDLLVHQQIDNQHLEGNVHIFHPAVMMRREAFEQVGGYHDDHPCAEDLDLFLRLAECGQVANLPEVLTKYRQHLASQGYALQQLTRHSLHAATDSARLRRGLPPLEWDNADTIRQATTADHYRKWSWWSLGGGNVRTARKYAIAAVQQQPFSIESWRTIYCSLRGH